MQSKLVAWGHAVKARRDRGQPRRARALPVLFALLDRRIDDPRALVASLPSGPAARLFGVVLRDPDPARRAALGRALAPLCRSRGYRLYVAADPRLALLLRAGVHLPGGRRGVVRIHRTVPRLASAHDLPAWRRAARAGAALCLVSPVFPTASHPGARPLGPARLALLSRAARLPHLTPMRALALGGIDAATARALPRSVAGAGAIGAFLYRPGAIGAFLSEPGAIGAFLSGPAAIGAHSSGTRASTRKNP